MKKILTFLSVSVLGIAIGLLSPLYAIGSTTKENQSEVQSQPQPRRPPPEVGSGRRD